MNDEWIGKSFIVHRSAFILSRAVLSPKIAGRTKAITYLFNEFRFKASLVMRTIRLSAQIVYVNLQPYLAFQYVEIIIISWPSLVRSFFPFPAPLVQRASL